MKKESEETKIAVLVEKVSTMNDTLTKLDAKFDSLTDKFASKTEVDLIKKDVEDLKGWKYKAIGAAGALGLGLSAIKDWLIG